MPKYKKPLWHCFLPLMIEIPIAITITIISFKLEVSSFYSDPSHVGFAIPVVTFLLFTIFVIITFILSVICLVWIIVRYNKQKQ